jgi:hypothetical protein
VVSRNAPTTNRDVHIRSSSENSPTFGEEIALVVDREKGDPDDSVGLPNGSRLDHSFRKPSAHFPGDADLLWRDIPLVGHVLSEGGFNLCQQGVAQCGEALLVSGRHNNEVVAWDEDALARNHVGVRVHFSAQGGNNFDRVDTTSKRFRERVTDRSLNAFLKVVEKPH